MKAMRKILSAICSPLLTLEAKLLSVEPGPGYLSLWPLVAVWPWAPRFIALGLMSSSGDGDNNTY